MVRWNAQMGRQTKPGQQTDELKGGIGQQSDSTSFKAEPLAHRSLKSVVAVVPTLAQGDECHPGIIATGVIGRKWLVTTEVGDRIYGGNTMEQNRSAQEKGGKILKSTHPPGDRRKEQRGQKMQAINQNQNRIGFDIGWKDGRMEVVCKKPTNLRIPKALPTIMCHQRRMRIYWSINVAMMLNMMCLPPAGTHLTGRCSNH
jgi:hypothetical protein